jgi:hypothetical protein
LVAVTVVLALLHGGEEIDGTKKDLSEKPEFCLCRGRSGGIQLQGR